MCGPAVVASTQPRARNRRSSGMLREPDLGIILTTWSGDPLPWIGVLLASALYLAPFGSWIGRTRRTGSRVADRGLAGGGRHHRDRARLRGRRLRREPLQRPHGPAPAAVDGRPSPARPRGADDPRAARGEPKGSPVAPPSRPAFLAGQSGLLAPGRLDLLFAVAMWATHFSPLFNAALENHALHSLEHLIYLVAGVLFWWPVIAADPMRWRLTPSVAWPYLAAQMPFNTAVGLAIYFAPGILYPHYASSAGPGDPIRSPTSRSPESSCGGSAT